MSRVFASTIHKGDSLSAEFALPLIEAPEEWEMLRLNMRLVSSQERETYELDATPAEGNATLRVPSTATAQWPDGVWRYSIIAIGDADSPSVCTLESGVIDVRDALSPKTTFPERLVCVLEEVIEAKMTGRGDVMSYEIGDRRTDTMTLKELNTALTFYREEVSRARSPRQYWHVQ